MNLVLYTERVSRYMEEEWQERFRKRTVELWSNREIFGKFKKEIWRKRQQDNKSSKVKKNGARE